MYLLFYLHKQQQTEHWVRKNEKYLMIERLEIDGSKRKVLTTGKKVKKEHCKFMNKF